MSREHQFSLQPFIVGSLVEGTGNDVVVFLAHGLIDQKIPIQRIEGDVVAPTDHDIPCHIADARRL